MRIYEELFIVRPDITDEEIDPLIEQLAGVVTTKGGKMDKTDKWGVRKLAYPIQKRSEGYYVLLQFTSGPDTVREIERRLRVTDSVMKFITVRIDEKLKKIEKRKKSRDKRAARRPPPPVAPPSMPLGEPVVAMPGGPMPGSPMPGSPSANVPPSVTPAVPAPAAAPVPPTAPAPVVEAEKE